MEKIAPRVLLVDDDSDIIELLEYNLLKEGYEVLGVTDPHKVIQAVNHFLPHIIIMDIMMPDIDGFELCLEIRSTAFGKDLPIFFMTTGSEKLSKTALKFGGDDFIQKFSGLRTLINRVNLVLKRRMIIRKREETVKFGKWTLVQETKSVIGQKGNLAITDLEFDLLFFLAQNPGRSIPIKYLYNVIETAKINQDKFSIPKYLKQLKSRFENGLIDLTSEYRVRLKS